MDELDEMSTFSQQRINDAFARLKEQVATWEPRPCPPRDAWFHAEHPRGVGY